MIISPLMLLLDMLNIRVCLCVMKWFVLKLYITIFHKGILGIKAIDLPLVVRRSQRKSISRKHKRELGKSIELRNPNIETREEFGHWELDTVRGTKDKTDHVLISLLERKSRLYVAL